MITEKKRKVLVIDDEETVLGFFKRLLKGKPYNVTALKSGKAALALVK